MAGRRKFLTVLALVAASPLALGACSAGSLGSSEPGGGDSAEATTITYLVDNGDSSVKSANLMIAAFQKDNPGITIKLDTRPGGSDGDNLVKTKLATSDMAEVFGYNNGSLFQALKPSQNLTDLSDQPWASGLQKLFTDSTTADGKLYGAPLGTAFGGGVLYNIPGVQEAGPDHPQDVGRVHGQQRRDQEGRRHHSGRSHLRRHLDLPAAGAGRLRQRRSRQSRLRHAVHRQPGQVRDHPGGPGWLRAHPAAARGRLLQQGLRLGEVQRRAQGHRERQGGALPADRWGHVRPRRTVQRQDQ